MTSRSEVIHPKVTVMTAVYNGEALIGAQMRALGAQAAEFPWEYIVIDNGSTDATVQVVNELAETFPVPVHVIDGSARRNIPFVRNLGVAAARGDYLVFCDQDDEVQEGWLAAAYEGLQQFPAVMGLMRELNDDPLDDSRIINPALLEGAVKVETCNFGIRKAVFQEVGGFDEGLPAYGLDDSELYLRLLKAGYAVTPWPSMVLRVRTSRGLRSRTKKIFGSSQAEIYVWEKHSDIFGSRLNWPYFLGENLHAWRAALRYPAHRREWAPEPLARQIITGVGHCYAFARLKRE